VADERESALPGVSTDSATNWEARVELELDKRAEDLQDLLGLDVDHGWATTRHDIMVPLALYHGRPRVPRPKEFTDNLTKFATYAAVLRTLLSDPWVLVLLRGHSSRGIDLWERELEVFERVAREARGGVNGAHSNVRWPDYWRKPLVRDLRAVFDHHCAYFDRFRQAKNKKRFVRMILEAAGIKRPKKISPPPA